MSQQLTEIEKKSLEKYEKKKHNDRERQKKYYQKNKELIKEKQKLRNKEAKVTLNNALSKLAIEVVPDVPVVPDVEVSVPEPPIQTPSIRQSKKNKKGKPSTITVTQSPTVTANPLFTYEKLTEMIKNDPKINDKKKTKADYIDHMKKIFDFGGCVDMISCLSNGNYKNVISKLWEAKNPKNQQLYSVNSRKAYFQSFLKILDNYLKPHIQDAYFKIVKKAVDKEFQKLKTMSMIEKKEKQKTVKHIRFDTYLEKIKEEFGTDSKHYLLGKLYEVFTCRDDYGGMIIIDNKNQNNQESNYLLKEKNKYTIILNSYKTSVDGDPTIFHLKLKNNDLKLLIDAWILKNKLKSGNYFIGKSSLSKYISNMNQKIGVKGAINTLRQMRISQTLSDSNISIDERDDLSNSMMHSVVTQLLYQHQMEN